MKYKKKTSLKAIYIILIIILMAISLLIYTYVFKGNFMGWKNPNTTTIDNENSKQEPNTQTKNNSNTSDTPPSPTDIPNSDKKNVEISITSHTQKNSILQIRTLISSLDNTGTCTLTIVGPNEKIIVKTSKAQSLASASTCQGFDIPLSDLSSGLWRMKIDYLSEDLIGSISLDEKIE